MLAATILHSLSAVCVLLIVIGFGVFLARKGWFDAPSHRGIVSKLVNAHTKSKHFRSSKGRLAQLVQSICLTSRGSAVRIRQRPLEIFIRRWSCK